MKHRNPILSLLLLTSAFAQNAGFSSSVFDGSSDVRKKVAFAQPAARNASGFDSAYRLSLAKPVQDKNFYLLSLFQRNQQARRLLSRNKALRQLANQKVLALKKASRCDIASCFEQLMRFDDPTIDAVASELQKFAHAPELRRLVRNDMRPSGVFIK